MLLKFSALSALASVASAITMDSPPEGWVAGTSVNITWQSIPTDPPSFTLLITNPNVLKEELSLGVVNTSTGYFPFTVFNVDGPGWYLEAIKSVEEPNNIYAQSAPFTIYPALPLV